MAALYTEGPHCPPPPPSSVRSLLRPLAEKQQSTWEEACRLFRWAHHQPGGGVADEPPRRREAPALHRTGGLGMDYRQWTDPGWRGYGSPTLSPPPAPPPPPPNTLDTAVGDGTGARCHDATKPGRWRQPRAAQHPLPPQHLRGRAGRHPWRQGGSAYREERGGSIGPPTRATRTLTPAWDPTMATLCSLGSKPCGWCPMPHETLQLLWVMPYAGIRWFSSNQVPHPPMWSSFSN